LKKREHVTLITCVTANGDVMKHALIFEGKTVPADLNLHTQNNCCYCDSFWVDKYRSKEEVVSIIFWNTLDA